MKKIDTILMIGLMILSALTSFMFISYGMNIILAKAAPQGMQIFAYVTTAYGLANISILSVAWSSRDPRSSIASKLIALCYLGVFVMDMVNSGMKGGLEVVGVAALGLVLWANWFAVKKVVSRS